MKNTLLIIVIALVVGAAGFFGGMKYQQSKLPNLANFRDNGNRQLMLRQGNQNGGNFSPVSGKIIAKDEKSITVELRDGGSKIVLISEASKVNKTEAGSTEDLVEGAEVMVMGAENSDGSVTAQSIQLNPDLRLKLEGNPDVSPVN